MAIQRLDLNDAQTAEKWDAFVLNHPHGTFFHRSGWQTILKSIFGHECYFLFHESNGKISGILPLAHVRSLLFGNSLVSLPFAVYGGAVAEDQTATEQLEQSAIDLALRLRVGFLEIRNNTRRRVDWGLQDLYYTFRRKFKNDTDANLLEIPRKQRAMIRKGINNKLFSRSGEDVEIFYSLYSDNVRRHGTPGLPKKYFFHLLNAFPDDCDILIVMSEVGEPVSGVFSFYFRDEVLPYYSGDMSIARQLAANDFKYWELLRRSVENGYMIFDFGRSKRDTGSFFFKKNWGFEAQELYYEYLLLKRDSIPQNNPSNKKFRLAIEAWRRLPLSITTRVGPYLVRALG